jgi:hypothetical protein
MAELRLMGGERQLPCRDDCKKHLVRLDSASAIHCTSLLIIKDSWVSIFHRSLVLNLGN